MQLYKTGKVLLKKIVDLAQFAEAGIGAQGVHGIAVAQVGNGDNRHMPGGQLPVDAGAAALLIPQMVQAFHLVDRRESFQNHALIIPQGDGPVLMAQAFAGPGIEMARRLGSLAPKCGIRLGYFLYCAFRIEQFGDGSGKGRALSCGSLSFPTSVAWLA